MSISFFSFVCESHITLKYLSVAYLPIRGAEGIGKILPDSLVRKAIIST
jgi:hypothetical protein